MDKWISWASNHRLVASIMLGIIYLLIVLPHEVVGVFIAGLFRKHGRPFYDKILLIIFVVIFIFFLAILYKRIMNHPQRRRLFAYILINTILAILCYTILFVVNVEAIHFLQYALFAVLLFPLIKNYFQVHIWSALAGTLDELYQYTILSPERTDYFDFNDVVINMIGAGFGLIAVRAYDPAVIPHTWQSFRKTWLYKLWIALCLIVTLSFVMGYASYYPAEGSYFVLLKKEISWFWYQLPPAVTFHVLTPLEGVILIILIFWLFIGIEKGSQEDMVGIPDES